MHYAIKFPRLQSAPDRLKNYPRGIIYKEVPKNQNYPKPQKTKHAAIVEAVIKLDAAECIEIHALGQMDNQTYNTRDAIPMFARYVLNMYRDTCRRKGLDIAFAYEEVFPKDAPKFFRVWRVR